jgi:hypothetical protein
MQRRPRQKKEQKKAEKGDEAEKGDGHIFIACIFQC